MDYKIPVLAVLGPTATGKTRLGIALAKRFGGEIVSCDSMQIYRDLPIGTAQPSAEELFEVPHHLVGFLDITSAFSVSDYVCAAGHTICELDARGVLPVLVGGTGLYARSLLRGFTFEEAGRSEEVRKKLFARAEREGVEALYQELTRVDPDSALGIHPNNVKRVIRALEYFELLGEPFSNQAKRSQTAESPYDPLVLCLSYRNRETLYERINSRVDNMIAEGLLEEAEAFFRCCHSSDSIPTAAQAIGYKELFPYFEGRVSLEEAVDNIKRESRRYAKRQLTWFLHEPDINVIYIDDFSDFTEITEEASQMWEEFVSGKGADAK